MYDDDFEADEDLPFPTPAAPSQPTPAELLPIAERVKIGLDNDSNANGGIVPFPAHLDSSNIIGALQGDERKKVDGLRAYGYRPTVFDYPDAGGRNLRFLVRFDHDKERKLPLPLIYCGKGKQGQELFWFSDLKGSKPLYGLHLLAAAAGAEVLVVEGEKTADAARVLFPDMVVVTWAGGANTVRRVDMSALEGRRVTFWPDNDMAGRRAGRLFLARSLEAGAASAAIVDVPRDYPEKWDLADQKPADGEAIDLAALVAAARAMSAAEAKALVRNPERRAAKRRLLGHKPGYSNVDLEAALVALEALDPAMPGPEWRKVARCWYFAFGPDGLAKFDTWSQGCADKYRAGEPARLWDGFATDEAFRALPLAWLMRRARRVIEEENRNVTIDAAALVLAEIEALNENHAVVIRGSKTAVMRETYDARFERFTIDYLKKTDFIDKHVRTIMLPGEDGKEGKGIAQGRLWFGTARRREYDGVTFMPGDDAGRNKLNLWRGFTVEPSTDFASWSKLNKHIEDHIAQGNAASFTYILNWLAFAVQNLTQPTGAALVLTGPKGAGKSILIELFGYLFGQHTFVTSISEDIVGKFNAHLETTLLLGVEEAFAPQNRAADGTLKDLITRKTLRVEDKFFSTWTSKNHLRIIMTSNNDQVVRADGNDRRYAVFEVATPFQADPYARRRYFGAMVEQMETGGYEAMLGELLARDISGWNAEAIPETEALQKQKLLNMSNDLIQSWYFASLEEGDGILSGEASMGVYPWSETKTVWVPVQAVVADYTAFAKRHGKPGDDRRLKNKLARYMAPGFESKNKLDEARVEKRQVKHYPFPPLGKARELFAKATGHKFE